MSTAFRQAQCYFTNALQKKKMQLYMPKLMMRHWLMLALSLVLTTGCIWEHASTARWIISGNLLRPAMPLRFLAIYFYWCNTWIERPWCTSYHYLCLFAMDLNVVGLQNMTTQNTAVQCNTCTKRTCSQISAIQQNSTKCSVCKNKK